MADVKTFCLGYRLDAYSDVLFTHARVPFPPGLARAVHKRRAEYLAGRFAAKMALKKMGVNGVAVASGAHGCPVWPGGIVGSITHSGGVAMAAVARARTGGALLGLDYEVIPSAETVDAVERQALSPREHSCLSVLPVARAMGVMAVFAAKEAFFKACYPVVRRYFDFSAVDLVHWDLARTMMTFAITPELRPPLGSASVDIAVESWDRGVRAVLYRPDPR